MHAVFPKQYTCGWGVGGGGGGIEYSTLLKEGREEVTGKRVLVY